MPNARQIRRDLPGHPGPFQLRDCLVVANNKITIDLQGHQIVGGCPGDNFGRGSPPIARDVSR
jgi:hypothetical protein